MQKEARSLAPLSSRFKQRSVHAVVHHLVRVGDDLMAMVMTQRVAVQRATDAPVVFGAIEAAVAIERIGAVAVAHAA